MAEESTRYAHFECDQPVESCHRAFTHAFGDDPPLLSVRETPIHRLMRSDRSGFTVPQEDAYRAVLGSGNVHGLDTYLEAFAYERRCFLCCSRNVVKARHLVSKIARHDDAVILYVQEGDAVTHFVLQQHGKGDGWPTGVVVGSLKQACTPLSVAARGEISGGDAESYEFASFAQNADGTYHEKAIEKDVARAACFERIKTAYPDVTFHPAAGAGTGASSGSGDDAGGRPVPQPTIPELFDFVDPSPPVGPSAASGEPSPLDAEVARQSAGLGRPAGPGSVQSDISL